MTQVRKSSLMDSPWTLVLAMYDLRRNSAVFTQSKGIGVGKIGDFQHISCHISELVQDMAKFAIDY